MRANVRQIGFLNNHPNQLQIVGEFQADTSREHDALYDLLNDPTSKASATFDTSKVPAEFVITIERPEPLPAEGDSVADGTGNSGAAVDVPPADPSDGVPADAPLVSPQTDA